MLTKREKGHFSGAELSQFSIWRVMGKSLGGDDAERLALQGNILGSNKMVVIGINLPAQLANSMIDG